MKLSVHLCFDGQCEDAFRAYESILGGKISTMLRYGDSPMATETPTEFRNRILHATLELNNQSLTGVDLLPKDYRPQQGFYVLLTIDKMGKAQEVFELLSIEGDVRMPFEKTFWSPGFGVVVDRFGTPWEINCGQSSMTI